MQTADVDGQASSRADRGVGETMRLGTGAEWTPCGIVQEGGCHSGGSRRGRSRRRDLALGVSRNILCSCVGAWMTDDKQPAHN